MVKFEKVKELIAELENHKEYRHVYIKKDGYCYRVVEIYVDNEGDLILETE